MSVEESSPRPQPNTALRALRIARNWSQLEFAEEIRRVSKVLEINLACDEKRVGRWERGEVHWPSPAYRRVLVLVLDVPVSQMGFMPPHQQAEPDEPRNDAGDAQVVPFPGPTAAADPATDQRLRYLAVRDGIALGIQNALADFLAPLAPLLAGVVATATTAVDKLQPHGPAGPPELPRAPVLARPGDVHGAGNRVLEDQDRSAADRG